MKVVDFINKLNDIGFDENTELTFSCVYGDTGNWYELKPIEKPFAFGEDLTGEPYKNDTIDFELDVDSCEGYLEEQNSGYRSIVIDALKGLISDL